MRLKVDTQFAAPATILRCYRPYHSESLSAAGVSAQRKTGTGQYERVTCGCCVDIKKTIVGKAAVEISRRQHKDPAFIPLGIR